MQIILNGLITLSKILEDLQNWKKNGSKPAEKPVVVLPTLPDRVQARLDEQDDFIGGKMPTIDGLNSSSGCIVHMGTIDGDEIIKFSLKPDFKPLANTLTRNALALEMRSGVQFPRDDNGEYLVFSEANRDIYEQYFGIVLMYTGGLRGSLTSYKANKGFFEETNDLEVLWKMENAPSPEDFVMSL